MKIRKSVAGIAAAGLAIAGVAVASAPAAIAAGPSTATLYCDVAGISTAVATWNTTWTVNVNGSPSGATVNAGASVPVNLVYAAGPNNGGPASTGRTQAVFQVLNGATVVGTYTSPWTADAAVAGGGVFPGATLATSFTAPAAGTYSVVVKNVLFEGYLGGGSPTGTGTGVLGAAVSCNGNAGPYTPSYAANNPTNNQVAFGATALTTNGPNFSYTVAGQTVAGYGRGNQVITVSDIGALFTGTSISSVTVGGAAATNTLAITAGALTGTITIPVAATTGLTNIVVTTNAETVSKSITILGTPTLSLAPAAGGPGQNVAVTGSNFNPSGAATLYLCDAAAGFCAPFTAAPTTALATGSATVNTTGAFSGTITIPTTSLASLRVQGAQGSGPTSVSASAFFTVNADTCTRQVGTATPTLCETKQNISATVNPGALSQQATAYAAAGYTSTAIPMGAVTTSIAAQTLNGNINPITVTDVRGGTATWTLTASMPSLAGSGTATGATIENNNLALGAVSCAGSTGSATGITSGTGGNFASTLTICDATTNNADSAGDTKGGQWVANAPLVLTVPAFQQAGAYSSTITFTLT